MLLLLLEGFAGSVWVAVFDNQRLKCRTALFACDVRVKYIAVSLFWESSRSPANSAKRHIGFLWGGGVSVLSALIVSDELP